MLHNTHEYERLAYLATEGFYSFIYWFHIKLHTKMILWGEKEEENDFFFLVVNWKYDVMCNLSLSFK